MIPAHQIFSEALAHFYPPGSHRKAVERFFDNRVSFSAVRGWRDGRRGIPQWAIELLISRHRNRITVHRDVITHLEMTKAGPGLKAGARNLAAYLAKPR